MSVLNQNIVLCLNGNFQRIGWTTPAEAFIALMGEGKDGTPPALAIDIQYDLDEFGKPIVDKYSYLNTWDWEHWLLTEPRPEIDRTISTVRFKVRVPTIIVKPKFKQMPEKNLRPNKKTLREKYGNRCAYTGVELTNSNMSIDHVIPKSRWAELGYKGSPDVWENLAPCIKEVNHKKGNKLNEEAGLKLLVKLSKPEKIKLCQYYKGIHHPDHKHF